MKFLFVSLAYGYLVINNYLIFLPRGKNQPVKLVYNRKVVFCVQMNTEGGFIHIYQRPCDEDRVRVSLAPLLVGGELLE